ncbi:hypothetical protein SDC9_93546 [bioreactor metagenome]|uniref:Uncharacterized protein n=1 Tax=bioreactor metagenome TaxID=1076179 RepID=A0A645A0Y1_9ZZZZ
MFFQCRILTQKFFFGQASGNHCVYHAVENLHLNSAAGPFMNKSGFAALDKRHVISRGDDAHSAAVKVKSLVHLVVRSVNVHLIGLHILSKQRC